MVCPGCGGEYRTGFSRCVDCEIDLVPELPPRPDPVDPSALATVFVTGDRALLEQAKSLLDGAGIPCQTRNEDLHDLLDQGRLAPGVRADPLEIQLQARHWREAATLLGEAGLEPVEATPEEQLADGAPADEPEEPEALERAAAALPLTPAERRLRSWELALLLLVVFSSSVLTSLRDWWTDEVGSGSETVFGDFYNLQRQVIYLGLLAYVLARRGRSFRDLGLAFRPVDLPAGALVAVTAVVARRLAWRAMNGAWVGFTGHGVAHLPSPESTTGLALGAVSLLYSVIDPVFEELIVRAFLMTELEALTGSTGLAIAASVALQTSYHLYQGTAHALAAGASFLVYACFYAHFRRITPVILAHAIWDVTVTLGRI